MNLRRKLLLCGSLLVAIGLWLMSSTAVAGNSVRIRVASKPFTESFILSEMAAQLIEATGEAGVDRRFGLGGPPLVFDALKSGEIDVDINYTGTLAHQLVKDKKNADITEIQAALAPVGITLSNSLGFNNTYAIAVRTETARRLRLATISDLKGHPELRGAFTPDF